MRLCSGATPEANNAERAPDHHTAIEPWEVAVALEDAEADRARHVERAIRSPAELR